MYKGMIRLYHSLTKNKITFKAGGIIFPPAFLDVICHIIFSYNDNESRQDYLNTYL